MSEHIHIGMPVFNGESHLKEALESLLNQSHENFEIFIMDNASTDATQEIIQKYAKLDSRIKSYRETHWLNATANWNRTFELASRGAEIFMWATDDDLWEKDYIESLLSPLIENPGVVLSFCEAKQIDDEGQIIGHLYRDIFPGGSSALRRLRSIIRSGKYSAIYGLIRTQAVDWDPCLQDASFGSDLWFLLRLAACGNFYMVKRPLFFKRIGGISQTGADPSACYDPLKSWNIGDKEWNLIGELNLPWLTRLYTYYRLRFFGKTVFPQDKKIDWFLLPIFWGYMVWKNPRSLGIRSRLKKRLSSSCG